MTSSGSGQPSISTRDVAYADGDVALTGVLHWDAAAEAQPGILLVHGGGGLDEHARDQARRYAGLGYAVLACDMFGQAGAGDREQMMTRIKAFRDDPALLLRRAQTGLTAMAGCPEVGSGRGAVGFCFGGMTVLALARAGAELDAVVSMHGSLATKRPATSGVAMPRVLICHGAVDPHVPMTDVVALTEEMTEAGVDWQVNVYGKAMHGFTHTHAQPGAVPGVEYNRLADDRSFAAAGAFLAEALG